MKEDTAIAIEMEMDENEARYAGLDALMERFMERMDELARQLDRRMEQIAAA